jgi:RND family efflux transporter MFP subunit
MVPAVLKRLAVLSPSLLLFLFMPHLSHGLDVEAITKPSADISLSFVQHGKVDKVMVREGDHVAAGDLLASLEGQVEMVQYQLLTAKAKDTTIIKIGQAELLQKKEDLQQMEKAYRNGAVTDWEVDHARLAAETALLEVKLAEFEHAQDQLKHKEFKTALNNLHIRSPIQGIAEEVKIEKGESVQALAPVIRIVDIENLLIDIAVPVSRAKSLGVNQNAVIKFADEKEVQGKIDNIASVADSAANTLRISVITPNPGNRPAGERVTVSFPDAEKSEQ